MVQKWSVKSKRLALLMSSCCLLACMEPEGDLALKEAEESAEQIDVARSVQAMFESRNMKYIGTCEWLDCCADGNCDNNNGNPYCRGHHTCSDTTRLVAKPRFHSTDLCNSLVYICRRDNPNVCTNALVWETSYADAWEGNLAVHQALGNSGAGCNPDTCRSWGNLDVYVMDVCEYHCFRYNRVAGGCPPCPQ